MENYIHRIVRNLDSDATEKMHADLSNALEKIQTAQEITLSNLEAFVLQEAIDIICNVILDLEEEFTEGETT